MKKMFFYFLFLLFAVSITAVAQQEPQDPIRQHEGIAIEAPLGWWGWTNDVRYPGALDSMINKAGVDVIHFAIDRGSQMDTIINNYGFDVMASKMQGLNLNYVLHYTHAKYSVWEAEGNINYGANLQRNIPKTEIYNYGDTTFVRHSGNVPNSVDEMIYGPYPWYNQDVKYHGSDDGFCYVVPYTAEFRLMIEENDPPVPYNPNDTICVIQVTQRKIGGCTYVIADSVITRGKFNQLGQFKEFSLVDYKLTSDSCQDPETTRPIPDSTDCGTILLRGNVEFKVIWMGKSNSEGKPAYLLSVDKVTLSDDRG